MLVQLRSLQLGDVVVSDDVGKYELLFAFAPASIDHFHSHTLADVFPDSSVSYSNTPTRLLRKDSFPVGDVLKNN